VATLTPYFSANRTVREYTDKFYVPGAKAYQERASENGAAGRKIVFWKRSIELGWSGLHFGEVKVQEEKDPHTGAESHSFEVQLSLGDISADMLRVELFANGINGEPPERHPLNLLSPAVAGAGMTVYGEKIPATRPAGDYTARALPWLPGVSVPLETAQILWQR
jgi:starch phosphorylase